MQMMKMAGGDDVAEVKILPTKDQGRPLLLSGAGQSSAGLR